MFNDGRLCILLYQDMKEWKGREKRNPDGYNLSAERKPERDQFDSKKECY